MQAQEKAERSGFRLWSKYILMPIGPSPCPIKTSPITYVLLRLFLPKEKKKKKKKGFILLVS